MVVMGCDGGGRGRLKKNPKVKVFKLGRNREDEQCFFPFSFFSFFWKEGRKFGRRLRPKL